MVASKTRVRFTLLRLFISHFVSNTGEDLGTGLEISTPVATRVPPSMGSASGSRDQCAELLIAFTSRRCWLQTFQKTLKQTIIESCTVCLVGL